MTWNQPGPTVVVIVSHFGSRVCKNPDRKRVQLVSQLGIRAKEAKQPIVEPDRNPRNHTPTHTFSGPEVIDLVAAAG